MKINLFHYYHLYMNKASSTSELFQRSRASLVQSDFVTKTHERFRVINKSVKLVLQLVIGFYICIMSPANWAVFGCYISSKIDRNKTNQIEKFMMFV